MSRQTVAGCVLFLCSISAAFGSTGRASQPQGGRSETATLPAPLLLHPGNGASLSPVLARSGVLFSWVSVPGSVSYRLEWLAGESVSEATVFQTTYLVPLSYPSGTRVDWRVTPLDETGTRGASSETWVFFIGSGYTPEPTPQATPTPPSFLLTPPMLLAPEDGAQVTLDALREGVVLRWTAVAGSFGYQVNYTLDGIPQPPRVVDRTSLSFSLTLDRPATIQWAVQALGGGGQAGNSSAARSFSVIEPGPTPTPRPDSPGLDPPVLLSPEDATWVRLADAYSGIEFQWSPVTGAAAYVFQAHREEDIETVKQTGRSSISVLFLLAEETDLHWTVATVDDTGVIGSFGSPRLLRIRLGNPGDLDLSGATDARDLFLFSSTWYLEKDHPLLRRADLDGDGFVTGADVLRFREISRTADR